MRQCPVCKKDFLPATQHVYKIGYHNQYVCSWGCVRAYEKQKELKKASKKQHENESQT